MQELLEAIAVTAELTQTDLSKAAARVMADDLARYPLPQVLGALTRCRRELASNQRLSIAAVIQRLEDGRPGPEEAWAMIPKDESTSVVWTQEMATAFGVALPLMDDQVAARMAFKETYAKLVAVARDTGTQATWMPSLGQDPYGRESALMQAVEKGRIKLEHAQRLLPHLTAPKQFADLLLKVEQPVAKLAPPIKTYAPDAAAMKAAEADLSNRKVISRADQEAA